MRRSRGLASIAMVGALTLVAAGCGSDNGGGGGGGTVIRGTTDQPISLDPAGAYDLPSYDAIYNIYQNLLTYEPSGTKPVPEAAESCDFTNDTTYECTLKDGIKFSDGSDLTAEDVKYSFDRNIEISSPNGASSLLAGMKSIEAPDDKTVVFHLKAPDATWPSLLTAASFAIVPSDVYPNDKLQPDDQEIGSGRYEVAQFTPGQQLVLQANSEYTGDDPPKNDTAIFQYFDTASALKLAIQQGDVDVAYRSLTPTDLSDLADADGVSVVEGTGTEIRYLFFNLDLQPGDDDAQKLAIRQAVAQVIDRQAVADNVYEGTVEPMYSMVPQGVQFATKAFQDEYGQAPDVPGAKKTLEDAGVDTPVPLELWWTPSHYGPVSGDEFAEYKHQLDDSGLFDVTLKSSEWNQYSTAQATDKYPQGQLGWFPDYPDADDYSSPFYITGNYLNNHYSNPEMDKLLADEKASTNDSQREQDFDQIQKIGAKDAPTIPLWQGKQVAAVREGVNGVDETFDAAFIWRFWLISKD
jgi:peptide/nickel transport system substrate-binding protein